MLLLLLIAIFSSVQHSTPHIKNASPEITDLLETSDSWNFDIISLERLTEKRPLVTLGINIMERFDVCSFLKIEEKTLVNWLTMIELNYKAKNPYHNSTHASDVLHATAYFLSNTKISVGRFYPRKATIKHEILTASYFRTYWTVAIK